MIKVVFDGVAEDASDRAVQSSVANVIKKKLQAAVSCKCKQCHIVLVVGGAWRMGDFSVMEVSACCMEALAVANLTLFEPASEPTMLSGFTRSALSNSPNRSKAVSFSLG